MYDWLDGVKESHLEYSERLVKCLMNLCVDEIITEAQQEEDLMQNP